MKRLIWICSISLLVISCKKRGGDRLDKYAEENTLAQNWLIACAAGNEDGFDGDTDNPISVFFYPEQGATDYKYFSTGNLSKDKNDYSNYKEWKDFTTEPVFNGYLRKFKINCSKEHWGIVTYKIDDSLRISDPIKILYQTRKTETDQNLITVTENGLTPSFDWKDGQHNENVIYFQVISDNTGNLISGTYTTEKNFTFYDTSNVVIDITPGTPVLWSGQQYSFTLMSVSDDNWVNVAAFKTFITN